MAWPRLLKTCLVVALINSAHPSLASGSNSFNDDEPELASAKHYADFEPKPIACQLHPSNDGRSNYNGSHCHYLPKAGYNLDCGLDGEPSGALLAEGLLPCEQLLTKNFTECVQARIRFKWVPRGPSRVFKLAQQLFESKNCSLIEDSPAIHLVTFEGPNFEGEAEGAYLDKEPVSRIYFINTLMNYNRALSIVRSNFEKLSLLRFTDNSKLGLISSKLGDIRPKKLQFGDANKGLVFIEDSITINEGWEELAIVGADLGSVHFPTNSIRFFPDNCSQYNVTVRISRSNLSWKSLQRNAFGPDPKNICGTIKIDLTQNELMQGLLPERAFESLLRQAKESYSGSNSGSGDTKGRIDLTILSDPLRCCHETNAWIFKLTQELRKRVVNTTCLGQSRDLSTIMMSSLKESCKQDPDPPLEEGSLATILVIVGGIVAVAFVIVALTCFVTCRRPATKRADIRSREDFEEPTRRTVMLSGNEIAVGSSTGRHRGRANRQRRQDDGQHSLSGSRKDKKPSSARRHRYRSPDIKSPKTIVGDSNLLTVTMSNPLNHHRADKSASQVAFSQPSSTFHTKSSSGGKSRPTVRQPAKRPRSLKLLRLK